MNMFLISVICVLVVLNVIVFVGSLRKTARLIKIEKKLDYFIKYSKVLEEDKQYLSGNLRTVRERLDESENNLKDVIRQANIDRENFYKSQQDMKMQMEKEKEEYLKRFSELEQRTKYLERNNSFMKRAATHCGSLLEPFVEKI